jgi:ABC-2 type transport system ATP-binding protein
MDLIEVTNVTKGFTTGLFGKRNILRNIDLKVRQGDLVVLRGANGAGKSTLLKIILGLQQPDSGSVKLCGVSPTTAASKLNVGVVFQEVTPPNSLKVKELIDLVRSYYPDPLSTQEVLETVGLTDQQNSYPSDLAGGQKQRLYFAIALVGRPKLLILDEPTKNLDAAGQEAFWNQVEQLKQSGVTILMVTHIQSEQEKLQDLATHIITLTDGKLVYDKQPEQAQIQASSVALLPARPVNPLQMLIAQSWAEVLQVFRTPTYLGGILLFSALAAFLPFDNNNSEQLNQGLTFFSAISLLLFSVGETCCD